MGVPEKVTIGDCELWCGDCLDIIPNLSPINSLITDPPYGTQELGMGYGRRQNYSPEGRTGRMIANDIDLSALAAAFPLCLQLIPTGWLAVFFAARRTPDFVQATAQADWFGTVIWDKKSMGLGYHIRYEHEEIAVFRQGAPLRPNDALPSILRAYSYPGEKLEHPHNKPVQLLKQLVEWCCPRRRTVIDPFMGSGSTGVACVQLGRKFIGVEIESRYFDLACRRIEAAYAQLPLFPPPAHAPVQTRLFATQEGP